MELVRPERSRDEEEAATNLRPMGSQCHGVYFRAFATPGGTKPAGPDRSDNRERNIGIDEEHSRRPKGGFRW
jgi:hypothetical protein